MSTPDPQQPSEPRQPSEPQRDPAGQADSATVQIPQPQGGMSFDKPAGPAPAPPYEQPTAPAYGPQTTLPYDPLPGRAYDPRTGLPLGPPPTSPYGPQGPAPYNAPSGHPAGYGPPYQGWYPPPGYVAYVTRPTNGMAIASLVLGILWIYWVGSIMALIFGYVARQQIAERGEPGGGLAIAGIVLGWIGVGTLVLVLLFLSWVDVPPSRGF
ncbi:DUF4190 domain-containing protein [Pseudonocardia hierapolitana]|nr:DUF4190 domain-containing protein [Pseudonocardia hierapolitana]